MHPDILKILFTEQEIADRIKEMAAEINRDYAGRTVTVISVLKGAFIFMADLMRELTVPARADFISVSSYGKRLETSGAVRILKDLDHDIMGKDLLVVEDILDSGTTLNYILNMMTARKPASIRLCTLLDKPSRRKVPVHVDYSGFEVPDEFVVGYGLDYDEYYRNLPYIGVLKSHIYT